MRNERAQGEGDLMQQQILLVAAAGPILVYAAKANELK